MLLLLLHHLSGRCHVATRLATGLNARRFCRGQTKLMFISTYLLRYRIEFAMLIFGV